MKQLFLFVFSSIFILNACNNPNEGQVNTTETAEVAVNSKLNKPKATMKVPEVMDFAEFQKRIQKDDDTLYIYNFWATWCMPCVKEMPYFEQVHDEYANQKVKLIFVSLDFIDLLSKKLVPFINKRQISEDVWLLDERNPNSWIDKVSEKWTGSIPATLFMHAPSKYEAFYERSFEYETLKEVVEEVLKEAKPQV
ncbi:MAG: TlpA disulfide reductase family protein [Chitinophagales bacterium]